MAKEVLNTGETIKVSFGRIGIDNEFNESEKDNTGSGPGRDCQPFF